MPEHKSSAPSKQSQCTFKKLISEPAHHMTRLVQMVFANSYPENLEIIWSL